MSAETLYVMGGDRDLCERLFSLYSEVAGVPNVFGTRWHEDVAGLEEMCAQALFDLLVTQIQDCTTILVVASQVDYRHPYHVEMALNAAGECQVPVLVLQDGSFNSYGGHVIWRTVWDLAGVRTAFEAYKILGRKVLFPHHNPPISPDHQLHLSSQPALVA